MTLQSIIEQSLPLLPRLGTEFETGETGQGCFKDPAEGTERHPVHLDSDPAGITLSAQTAVMECREADLSSR